MVRVLVLPQARAEMDAARRWYDQQVEGLGTLFLTEVDKLILRLAENPRAFPLSHAGLRRALLRRFPYALFFRIEPDAVYILACAHNHRDPATWPR
ncbi:type II toxin-antitoxin system RelE/ParE family toxin [Niveispirillum cyanobacteriorum]|uniref:Type II toxin-antitoxin system RelE/ParE family toxin n=1 Tax=Niveispirillum cyanobacteriorum TaxID=1612173 RepID=A0A2K9NBF1_9PROT|nr:type II toxin-antitoxin system RelE/ParE family toxin [Niveispirillum cyanobacteriorum]AUN30444.1 type II toxin-antitoxin system RelE/ParE family toxin [Niveispirillum cyanobacteriorum]GGE54554.1 toxin, RelE family protein [Niveispirillum cyanobacteriorum]